MRLFLRLIDGKAFSFEDLVAEGRLMIPYIAAVLLYVLAVAVGFVLFIIPGIYLMITYQFFLPLIVDHKFGAIRALQESARLTRGVKWKLVGYSCVGFGIALLGLIALGIGLLVAIPVVSLANVLLYRLLLNRASIESDETSDATGTLADTNTNVAV